MLQPVTNTVELARRIQAGCQAAEAEFAETFSHGLLLSLLGQTQDPEIAKDCCQQALLITLVKMRAGEIVNPEYLASFLRHTAVNVAISHFRKEKRYTNLNEDFFPVSATWRDTAARDKDCDTLRLLLREVLDLLTVSRDREILQRYYLHDEDKVLIRHDLGISSAHFDRVLYRAKKRVCRMLEKHQDVKDLLFNCLGEGLPVS